MTVLSSEPRRGNRTAPTLETRPTEAEALEKLRTLPPFSAVAAYLFELVSQEDIGLRKLSDIIRADARLSKDTLQIANSALFGRRNPVTGVLHAIVMLGLSRIRALVTTAAVKDFLGGERFAPAMVRSWRHNLACALICEEITRKSGRDCDFAYTAGLLHDIGRLAMLRTWMQEYSAVLDQAPADDDALLGKELLEFGIQHTRAGSALLKEWRLPGIFCEIAARHHAQPDRGQQDIAALVHLSCSLANLIGFSAAGGRGPALDAGFLERSPYRALVGRVDDLRFRIAEEVNAMECCLAG